MKYEMKYEVGDRVVALRDGISENDDLKAGDMGTIVVAPNGVRWDHPISGGHSCGGACHDGYGWYVDEFTEIAFYPDTGDPEDGDIATPEELSFFIGG